jgi:lipoprotein-anchoring transpeptidase ErfK/SrfK
VLIDRSVSAAAAVALVAGLAGCSPPPHDRLEAASRAMQRAAEAGGVVRAPAVCAAAQEALLHVEAEMGVQRRRSFLSRDYAEAERLATDALRASQICALHARAARERSYGRASAALQDLQEWIARATALARHIPDDEGVKRDLSQAEISLGEGRDAFERREFERAEEAAARGRAVVNAAIADMHRFIETFRAAPERAAWKRWVQQTLRDSRRENRAVIIVDKLRRQLLLLRGDEELATYPVDLGTGGIDSKTRAGDESTPDGRYRVTQVRAPGQTRYYRALMLDYPNEEDRARFRRLQRSGRVARSQGIGGDIEIHGKGGRGVDWTQGCVALENGDMDDLVPRVGVGTRVTIVGTIPDGAIP